jgi:hypothetical protein
MKTSLAAILLLAKTTMSQLMNPRTFPYLYLSTSDSSIAFVDVTRYIPLEYQIDPVLTSEATGITLFQPFMQSDIKYDSFRKRIFKTSFANCTAGSVTTQGYAAIVCLNNGFFLMSGDQVIAVDAFASKDSSCSPNGDLQCRRILIDDQITAGFVVCLKNNSNSVSIVVYAFQFTASTATLTKSVTCAQIANTTAEEAGTKTLKAAIVGVQYLSDSTPNLQRVNVTIIAKPYSEDRNDPIFDSAGKFILTLQVQKNYVSLQSSNFGLHRITDLITQNFHLTKIFCTTSSRFQYLFKSNCMFVTTLLNGLGSSQTYEIYFMNVSTSNLDDYTLMKKISIDYPMLTEILVDGLYLLAASVNVTSDSSCITSFRLIDIYSVYSETFDEHSTLINEFVTFELGSPPKPADGNRVSESSIAKSEETERSQVEGMTFKVTLHSNSRLAVVKHHMADGCQYIVVIDLDTMTLTRKNTTGQSVDEIAMAVIGEEPIAFYNRYDNVTQGYVLSKISNSRAFVGISISKEPTFSYFISLISLDGSIFKYEQFFINGTLITNMANFIDIRSEFFRQNFTYYSDLEYNFYLPWDNIRGADIWLIDKPQEDSRPAISAFKYFNQVISLDIVINTPESYFICDEFLVLLEKNEDLNMLRIMIFKLVYENDQELMFKSVSNQTIIPASGMLISFADTTLRTVKVYYANIICLLAIHTYAPNSRLDAYELRLYSYFGPNYLKSGTSFRLQSLNFDGNLQPQNQTSCIFVICTTLNDSFSQANSYLQIWNINPEDLSYVQPLAKFTPDSNIQPTFCPSALNQDLIDSRYVIVKSWCGGPNPTYSMKVDIETLQVSEFLNDRLIDKTGDICPSKSSFVKIYKGSLTGYTSSSGKSIVNQVTFFVSDLDLTKPYDKKCFIIQNLLVIGQRKVDSSGPYYAVYFFHTDKDISADKRLDQRIIIRGEVGVVTIYSTDSGAHVQYTLKQINSLGRITVLLSQTNVMTNLSHDFRNATWPCDTSIFFEFVSRGNTTAVEKMNLRFYQPVYSPELKKKDSQIIFPNSFNGTLLEDVTILDGPVFYPELVSTRSSVDQPASGFPYLEDLVITGLAVIRAPIFSSFDIFKAAGSFVVGLVNYPYGFDVCVYDNEYLQDPIVTSFLGLTAISAHVVQIDDFFYLLVQGNTIGDSSVSLFTYKAASSDLVFEPAGTLISRRALL